MHEMSLTQSLLDIVRQEMNSHGLTRLLEVKVACGRLSGVVPDAMHMAFTALTQDTDLCGACLNLEPVPLKLYCAECGTQFCPEQDCLAAFAPCPTCGQEIGHRIVSGQELNIEYIEAE